MSEVQIPANDLVHAVTVATSGIDGHVVIRSRHPFPGLPANVIYVDAQALAEALAHLGYTATPEEPDPRPCGSCAGECGTRAPAWYAPPSGDDFEGLSATVDRLADRLDDLTERVDAVDKYIDARETF